MGAGRIARVVRAKPKKKILSNRQLTRQVRSLSGNEGERNVNPGFLYTAATLTAGTPDINYFDDASLFNTSKTNIQHYYDVRIELSAAAVSFVRILYGFDEQFDGTNLVANQILSTTTNSASGLVTGECQKYKEANHKNNRYNPRAKIVRDIAVGLEANVPKVMNIRLPLYNRKTHSDANDSYSPFYPFVCALADSADAVITIGVDYVFTIL